MPAAKASPSTLIIVRNLSLIKENELVNKTSFLNLLAMSLLAFAYKIQSMATMSEMSSGGKPTEVKTITMVTRPACGIPAAPMLAAVAVILRKDSQL